MSPTEATCVKLHGGRWAPSHNLTYYRLGHSSWASPAGTLLTGGQGAGIGDTTELLGGTNGNSTIHFSLKVLPSKDVKL